MDYQNYPINAGDAEILHVFPINRDIGVCAKSTHQGISALDIRRYYLDDEQGVWRPTSKGLRIPLDQVEEMLSSLRIAAHARKFA